MGKYDDIINLPYPPQDRRSSLSPEDRAAQFLSFKSLTGFEDEIAEEGRWVDRKIELDESQKEIINEKLQYLKANAEEKIEAEITYFAADSKKDGGFYTTVTSVIVKFRQDSITLAGGEEIELDNIIGIIC